MHGLTSEFLADKPKFSDIADEFIAFIKGAELIIHNAPFDVGFIDAELALLGNEWQSTHDHCGVFDTLSLARDIHPGQRNSLDALCKRYEVDNAHRDLHGALLDAELLADVYLAMTGGQVDLSLQSVAQNAAHAEPEKADSLKLSAAGNLRVITASPDELAAHKQILQMVDSGSADGCIWLEEDSAFN